MKDRAVKHEGSFDVMTLYIGPGPRDPTIENVAQSIVRKEALRRYVNDGMATEGDGVVDVIAARAGALPAGRYKVIAIDPETITMVPIRNAS